MSWSVAHRGTEYRLNMAAVWVLCALGVVSSVVPIVEDVVTAALIAGAVLAVVIAMARRELRIRRRIADVDGMWHAPRPAGPAPVLQTAPAPRDSVPPRLTLLRTVEDDDQGTPAGRPATGAGGAA